MKKIFSIAIIAIAMIACSKKTDQQPVQDTNVMKEEPTAQPATGAAAGGANEGLTLIEGADCLGCHKVDAKLVGPSYQDVANKYTVADTDKLVDKIINGGKGSWGEIPMTPHTGMSKENAKKMVEYILSLKK
ncbi:MAG: c-type cytochrome [Bacteroidetes bacterium]|nr:c-type cytochrome [Bacteroidota bacterium]